MLVEIQCSSRYVLVPGLVVASTLPELLLRSTLVRCNCYSSVFLSFHQGGQWQFLLFYVKRTLFFL